MTYAGYGRKRCPCVNKSRGGISPTKLLTFKNIRHERAEASLPLFPGCGVGIAAPTTGSCAGILHATQSLSADRSGVRAARAYVAAGATVVHVGEHVGALTTAPHLPGVRASRRGACLGCRDALARGGLATTGSPVGAAVLPAQAATHTEACCGLSPGAHPSQDGGNHPSEESAAH